MHRLALGRQRYLNQDIALEKILVDQRDRLRFAGEGELGSFNKQILEAKGLIESVDFQQSNLA